MSVAAIERPSSQPRRALSVASSTGAIGGPGHVLVTVTGEVDAANAKEFAALVAETIADAQHVTLDLSGLGFFAFDGVTALRALNARLLRAGVPWRVLPGAVVSRVLALCDPEELIPVVRVNPPTPPRRPRLRLVG
ncbi:anti-anti-sigma regulatory factor (antagonist of anti-sigma factor) [Mycolicibacterium flavescens]|uniref:STAS domain-containing protein n=1 Tax=Mycobacterium neumannii TaxID=2048551 RepID=UPI000B93C44D|nr:STAS domain-containing protein [Mycobacterium neumannii]VEG39123.1 anti-anti-sigma regulatory factor (antagonist of anti-sigma factor) [Mycolicibacterium flavescens]